jgi:hypothetical protein
MVVTNKDKYNTKYGFQKDEGHSLNDVAKATGIKKSILQQVYNRGVGARKSNPESVRQVGTGKKVGGKSLKGKMSAEQWAMARVYSFVMGGTTQKTADKDLWTKHLMEKHKAHHTPKHMALMRKLIKEGKTFNQAHRQAQKEVGK